VQGYPFEVLLPEGFSVSGAVLSDQVRCVDWRARHALFEAGAPATTLADVVAKLAALIGAD
jgi:mRNA interferase MazF